MTRIILSSSDDNDLDMRTVIQAALDCAETAGGGEVHLAGGLYYIGPNDGDIPEDAGDFSLKLGNNVHLSLAIDATIIRRYEGYNSINAVIRNKDRSDLPVPGFNENIRVSGPGTITTLNSANKGRHLGFVDTNFLRIDGLRFLGGEDDWAASFRNCEDVVIANLVMDTGTALQVSALQFAGCRRVVVDSCDIRSGDDCIALVNDAASSDIGDMTDFVATNCSLLSRAANVIRLYVYEEIEQTIQRVRISNIVAKAGEDIENATVGGIHIIDENNAKRIFDVDIDGVSLDASQNVGVEWLVIDGVQRVRLSRVVARDVYKRAIIDNSDQVELLDCIVNLRASGAAATQQCLLVADQGVCTNIRIRGGQYLGATQHAIQIGPAPSEQLVGPAEVSHVWIRGAANNGLLLWNAVFTVVIGNSITGCEGFGIQEYGAGSDFNLFLGNQLINNTAGSLSLVGAVRTEAIRNAVLPAVVVPDTGGFRQTIDGWTIPSIVNGTTLALTEMDRGNGRFRAVRPGSVTGIVVTVSEPRTAGSMTVHAYKNTGNAGTPLPHTDTLLSVVINTAVNRAALPFPMNSSTASSFASGDELYLMIETTSWTVTTGPTNVFCALEIED